ncbi:hypothetical protein GCM10027590_14800 [Nocardiopsis nanhaiensis]
MVEACGEFGLRPKTDSVGLAADACHSAGALAGRVSRLVMVGGVPRRRGLAAGWSTAPESTGFGCRGWSLCAAKTPMILLLSPPSAVENGDRSKIIPIRVRI